MPPREAGWKSVVNFSFFLCVATCRLRSSTCDRLSRFCARHGCRRSAFPWPPRFAPPAPWQIAPRCSSASQLPWRSRTSHARASSATVPHLPAADHGPLLPAGQTRDLPVPVQRASAHARFHDRAGPGWCSRWRSSPSCFPPSQRRQRPNYESFEAQWLPALFLQTLRRHPCGRRLTARSRCGSLYSFIVFDLDRLLLLAGLPAHCERTLTLASACC
jgi:hypothetical protein